MNICLYIRLPLPYQRKNWHAAGREETRIRGNLDNKDGKIRELRGLEYKQYWRCLGHGSFAEFFTTAKHSGNLISNI